LSLTSDGALRYVAPHRKQYQDEPAHFDPDLKRGTVTITIVRGWRSPHRPERGGIVKAHAERVGLDPKLFAGHSLRAGFLTSAAKRGASVFKMMDQSRHRSVDTLRGYVRDADIFKDHAGAGLL
jgi:hypothetical protein